MLVITGAKARMVEAGDAIHRLDCFFLGWWHNALSSSNPLEVGQCLILPKLNFVNDCNGVSYGG